MTAGSTPGVCAQRFSFLGCDHSCEVILVSQTIFMLKRELRVSGGHVGEACLGFCFTLLSKMSGYV